LPAPMAPSTTMYLYFSKSIKCFPDLFYRRYCDGIAAVISAVISALIRCGR
jgi:formyltetrahydrofolate hydrolase